MSNISTKLKGKNSKKKSSLRQSAMVIIKPLFDLFIFFSILHVTLSFIMALITRNGSFFNVFRIVGITDFVPGIEKGATSAFFSIVITGSVYCYFYIKNKSKK